MEGKECFDKCIQECVKKMVNKYRTLCVGIASDEEGYECAVYHNGVKLIVKKDELLLIAIVKTFDPILKQIQNGKITSDSELNETQIKQIEKTLGRLAIDKPSWQMIAPDGIKPNFLWSDLT